MNKDFSEIYSLSNEFLELMQDEFEEKEEEEINEESDCIKCKSKNSLIKENGSMICCQCGIVYETCIDEQPEWRKYADDKNNNQRCGHYTNNLLPITSLSKKKEDFNNSKVRKYHLWFNMPYKERSRLNVFQDLEKICQRERLKKCIEMSAMDLYKKISLSDNITRGQNRKSVIAACLYFACRLHNETRCNEEIVQMFNNAQLQNKDSKISSTRLTKGCSKFNKLTKYDTFTLQLNTSTCEHFIKRYCKEIKLFDEYTDKALQIGRNIDLIEICSTHTPLSIATVTFKILIEHCNLNISKKVLNTNSNLNVTNVTTNKVYKKLKDLIHIITNENNMKILLKHIEEEKQKEMPDNLKKKLEYIRELKKKINT